MNITKIKLAFACFGVIFMLALAMLMQVDVSEAKSVPLNGRVDYDMVNQVLTKLNNLRASKGVGKLVLDETMTQIAEERAAEIGVTFSHTRPNGEECFSIFPQDNSYLGENIALGYDSAESVFEGWKDSIVHYNNMVNPNFTMVGIGCFCQPGGRICWVQAFKSGKAKEKKASGTVDVSKNISIPDDKIRLFVSGEKEVKDPKIYTYKMTMSCIDTEGKILEKKVSVDSTKISFSSSDPTVADIDEHGFLRAYKAGNIKVYAYLDSTHAFSASMDVEVNDTAAMSDSEYEQAVQDELNKQEWLKGAYKRNTSSGSSSSNSSSSGSKSNSSSSRIGKATIKKLKKNGKNAVKVSIKKVSKAKGYQLYISTSKKFKKKKAVITKKTSAVVKKLKAKKKYYVKVRAYTLKGKKKVYGKWSTIKSIKL